MRIGREIAILTAMKQVGIFRAGFWLTTGITFAVTAYAYAKNAFIDTFLFIFPTLLLMVLVGCVVSYFTFQRLSSRFAKAGVPSGLVVIFYAIMICSLVVLLYRGFVYFAIPFGYIFLPLTTMLAGGLVLLTASRIVASHLTLSTKIVSLCGVSGLLLIALLIFR